MFEKCIKCNRMGESCVPNLMLLPFADLMQWCSKRQKYLGWSNQTLADKSGVPVGTINRIKAGEEDCRYSTIRSILITLIGGTTDEFACTELVERELRQKEEMELSAAKLAVVETENEMLKNRLLQIDELHRKDIRVIKDEYQAEVSFLRDEVKAWREWHHSQNK